MWETRYQTPEYLFGKDPARFLTEQAHHLTPGATALAVADGEGRNSVYMAGKGLHVTALEFAPSAIAKAEKLARVQGVTVDFRHHDVLKDSWPGLFDIVVGIFIQFTGPDGRRILFDRMKAATRPGGLVLLHGYTPRQIEFGTGGPPFAENMYTEAILRAAFDGWDILRLTEYEREVQEGRGHSGQSALIDLVARKPG